MKIEVEICDSWDGMEKVCDSVRCNSILKQCNNECYHKPYKINGERVTVIDALARLFHIYK